jgi:hypothetical protein
MNLFLIFILLFLFFSSHVCLVNKFISVPRELRGLNCAAFVAGIVAGILDAAEFVRFYEIINIYIISLFIFT